MKHIPLFARCRANHILRIYGREMFCAHVAYMNARSPRENTRYDSAIGMRTRRLRPRRFMTMTAALILIMALTLTISSALGIHLFNFDLERYVDGFAILRNNEDEEDGKYFYQPEYLVEGYKLSYEETSDGFRDYSYESKSGDEELFYYVSECITRDADIRISTENCVEKTLVHGAYEILMYQNTEREQWNSAYLEIDGTYISIGGSISEEEILKIIDSLQIDREYAK